MSHDYGARNTRYSTLPMTHARPQIAREPEQLMGQVDGTAANQYEERFCKSLTKKNIPFYFRYSIGFKGQPGWKELDILASWFGENEAIALDGMDFVHRGSVAQSQDKLNDMIIMQNLKASNIQIEAVRHINDALLTTQQDSDKVVEEIFR